MKKKIKKLVKNYSNDFELGQKVREYVFKKNKC